MAEGLELKLGEMTESSARLSRPGGDELVGLYLKEVGPIPLLTADEEVILSRRWQKARRAQAGLRKGVPDQKTKRLLEKQVKDGVKARKRIIEANSRLVVSIARRYMGRGVPLSDLIQEGNLGLFRAVDRYDPERGYRFSTYAIWWIRQGVARAVAEQGRSIRLPTHMMEDLGKIDRTSRRLAQELGREPSDEEVATAAGIKPERVNQILSMAGEPLSLDTPVGDEETSVLGDFIVDEETPLPNAIASRSLLGDQVEEVLSTLTDREAAVIRLRFGLEDGRPYTLEEVGEKLGLTRERIRQIQSEAIRRLRHPTRSRYLKPYINN
ncbi:MAG: sigma-70 family RNA polymerase sigma factor [Chloroflexi bacterium]|nr:sigma-70 family RNA polymerase sigma factor [Chloroflexota bacterium]